MSNSQLTFKTSSALIALSGGVDSAVLLALAVSSGLNVHAATIVSEFTPKAEAQIAEAFAKRLGVPWHPIRVSLLSDERVRKNQPERCYLCKTIIMKEMNNLAEALGLEAVMDGTHLDDIASQDRLGVLALKEQHIISPFVDAGVSKKDILDIAKSLDIEPLPPSACLATRIPFGVELTKESLLLVDEAETALRNSGIRGILRVRVDSGNATVEVESSVLETAKLYENKLKQLGLRNISYRVYGGV